VEYDDARHDDAGDARAMTPGYRVSEGADLRARNTFGIAATAPLLVDVDDAGALPVLFADGIVRGAPLVLGGGSNVLFAGDPDGAVLALRGRRIAIVGEDDDGRVVVRADAGAVWHDCVRWTLAQGLAGLENLALIPGTVGAAPIQNIGAYGVELDERIHAVEAFEPTRGVTVRFAPADCGFAYRDSRFKREPDRFIVIAVEFVLSRTPVLRLDYAGIGDELIAMGVDAPTPALVAEAVCRIRRRKLPDPALIGNAGSFFKNPIVAQAHAETLRAAHPGMSVYPLAPFPADAAAHGEMPADSDHARCKLSAAWLIEQCGWKGHRDGNAGVSAQHALVLVNHGAASGAQLLDLARRIAESVRERFGVALEPEPRIVGAAW
jgi:UDP-N-acetylmuramate dehydrogenase